MSGQYGGGEDKIEQAILSMLSLGQVSELFKVSRITIDYWRNRHGLPVLKTDKVVLINKTKLDAWALSKKKKLPTVAAYVRRKGLSRDRVRLAA